MSRSRPRPLASLATDTAYQARVRATNAEGDSGWSDPPGSGRTNAPGTSAPGAPGDLGTTPGDGGVTLAWTAPGSDGGAAILKYQYRAQRTGTTAWTPNWTDVPDGSDSGGSTADETTFTVSGLTNGTEYRFQLRAVNSVGAGAAASDTAIPVRPPLPPGSGFLVGNFGQPVDDYARISLTQDIVGVFNTGARGAELHNIELRLFSRLPEIAQIPSATLYRASVTDTRATPGTRVAALTAAPGSPRPAATAQTVAFIAPGGTSLEAGATYLVVLTGSGFVRVESTTFPAEDAGGASGWTIDGVGAGNSSPYSYETTASLLMRVNGTAGAPATGVPGITGTALVGKTLTATTDGIEDEDGLTGATFTYQWLVDGAEINGATDSTYIVIAADEGKPIEVRVAFTDDAGNPESLTSYPFLFAPPLIIRDVPVIASNTPATGAPTITGTVRVGETLTANTTGIADSDGLNNATFTYQWLADDTDITDATGSTHALAGADEGKTVMVRLSFTDDRGHQETLTSTATAAVTAAPSPLTVSVESAPTSHNGSNSFRIRVAFSETPKTGFSYTTMRDHAFTVTGGDVTGARRLVSGKNLRWEITVQPSGNADVTVDLPATTNCAAQGAICTGNDDKLSNSLNLTVSGPN